MTNPIIRIIGLAATVTGLIAALAQDWVAEKKIEVMVDEKVSDALAENDKEKDEENEEES